MAKRKQTVPARPEPAREAARRVGGPSSTLRTFRLPFALTVGLFLVSLTPRVQSNSVVAWSFWIACAVLFAWQGILFMRWKDEALGPALLKADVRPQHYIQAMCHISVYLYWGWHWTPVYDYAWLLIGQILFAYAFDMLLQWSRRGSFLLGFGPFPIIFSTNLFLWFRDDWFYLQFVLVAVGFLGKELVRWNREGRSVHIFNPSAFSLGLFSFVLIATGTTHLTWGPEIASTLSLAPHIYVFLFLVGLVVMYFFSVTLVAASAAAVLFGLSALYANMTGVPYFLDSEIPSAVFLGLHLLVTDPSTSPRSALGKLVFGVLYGLGVFGLYSALFAIGAPTFYDKLLCVPLLNLMVPSIDRAVAAIGPHPALKPFGLEALNYRNNLLHMGAWILLFSTMTILGRTDGRHPGDSVPFWQQACADGRPSACDRLLQLETVYCTDASGWACNELGRHYTEGTITEVDPQRAATFYGRACELRFQPGCLNLLEPGTVTNAVPRAFDLRLLLREGGLNLMEMPEPDLYARACEHDWTFACERTALVR